jgi:hypothetical protein
LRDRAGMIGGGTWEGGPMFGMRRMAGSGIGAPKGTPAEIVEKLNKEINAAISDPDMKARLADLGGNCACWLLGRLWQVHRRRNRKVGQGGKIRGHETGVTGTVGCEIFHIPRAAKRGWAANDRF